MRWIVFGYLILLTTGSYGQWTSSDFVGLKQLEGAWAMPSKNKVLYEVWTIVNDFELRSSSYSVADKDTTIMESVRLYYDDGKIVYEPTVPNQNQGKAIPFRLSKIDSAGYTFENPSHDFPQKVVYKLTNSSLEVIISGPTQSGYRNSLFTFTKR